MTAQALESFELQPAAVIALHQKRAAPAKVEPYQMSLFDGSLALKVADPAVRPALHVPEPPRTPAVHRTAVIVGRAVLEVISGWRPATQLARSTSYPLQQDLERRAPRRPTGPRLQLRRITVSEPKTGVAEVCALADDPAQQRVRAVAMRFEEREGLWILTRLQAG